MPMASSGEALKAARDLVSFLKMLSFQWLRRTTGVLVLPGPLSVLPIISHLLLTTNSEEARVSFHFIGGKKKQKQKTSLKKS